MPGLVLELKQDELIIINGAVIKFRVKSRIEINGHARFLFGKQILLPDDSKTPARQVYLALQIAYVGNDDERAASLAEAKVQMLALQATSSSSMARDLLDRMLALAEMGKTYEALKLARVMIRHEDAMTGQRDITVGTNKPIQGQGRRQQVQST
jgi:flagellar protein FlbT